MRWILGAGALVAGLAAPLPKGWRISLLGFAASKLIKTMSTAQPLAENAA
jgi:hypothetical protein